MPATREKRVVSPIASSSSTSEPSSSTTASSLVSGPKPRRKPYDASRNRRSSMVEEPALASLGAIYVGWGSGQRDPAPLCCPRPMKQPFAPRYDITTAGQQKLPIPTAALASQHFRPSAARIHVSGSVPALSPGSLPPLPSSSSSLSSRSSSASRPSTDSLPPPSPHLQFPSLAPLRADLQTEAEAPSDAPVPSPSEADLILSEFTSLDWLTTDTLSDRVCAGASSSDATGPTLALPPLPAAASMEPLPLAPFTSSDLAELEASTNLSMVESPWRGAANRKLDTVPEDEYDESLWSAGEDPLGSSAATDVMSEASWAW